MTCSIVFGMTSPLVEALEDAERFAAIGRFDQCAEPLAKVAGELVSEERPDLLARAAWVAAIVALNRGGDDGFRELAAIAQRSLALAAGEAPARALTMVSRRTYIADAMSRAGDADDALLRVFGAHATLLAAIDGHDDDWRWALVDADRRDWPMMLTTLRAVSGTPSRVERLLRRARDPVAAVVVAVALGLGESRRPAQLARLCFREQSAIAEAATRIDELVAQSVLERDRDDSVSVRL